jgi:hypothetical protein
MNTKNFFNKEKRRNIFRMMSALMVALCLATSCGGNDDEETVEIIPPFDPALPVVISDFTPKTGGIGQRLVLYGQNFGNDTALVRVSIGGKPAKIIGVKGESLYCIVPGKAFAGNIEMRIGEEGSQVVATAAEKFEYQRKMVVSTLFGYRNERDDQPSGNFILTGDMSSFADATTMKNDMWMKFDPLNPDHLYIGYDGAALTRIMFRDSMYQRVMTKAAGGFDRLRSVDFTLDGQHMILADDRSNVTDKSTIIVSRANDFRGNTVLTTFRQCNGASIHPVNGEMYFNSYEKGQFYRFDIANAQYFGGTLGTNGYEELFKIQDVEWEFNIQIHPTGNYAYLVVVNKHYILRADYNWAQKKFIQPYLVCGEAKISGYMDGVGSAARLSRPYQGIFVKNPDYAGSEDEYDFYFCDRDNHCIRILTPDGVVTTFAGRGSSSLNANPYGFVEGDLRLEARFYAPTGLAYDEANKTFYVGDRDNRRIRKIALEEEEESGNEPEE